MAYDFKMERRVAFAETDMAGILHFSNYFCYMEEIEHAFFRSLGLDVHVGDEEGILGWARGEASCRFMKPLTKDDVVDMHLLVKSRGRRSITYEVIFRKNREEVARGNVTAVCVAKNPEGDGLQAVAIPEDVDAQIEVAPGDLF